MSLNNLYGMGIIKKWMLFSLIGTPIFMYYGAGNIMIGFVMSVFAFGSWTSYIHTMWVYREPERRPLNTVNKINANLSDDWESGEKLPKKVDFIELGDDMFDPFSSYSGMNRFTEDITRIN